LSGVIEPNYIYEVLLDVDAETGKDVTVKQLGETKVKEGIDYKIRALAYLSDHLSEPSNAMILSTQVFKWNETLFEIIKSDSTSYPIGINTGKENSHTVEIAVDLMDIGNPNGVIRGTFHASNAEGQSDFSDDFQLDPGSDAPVPTLSGWGMIILAVLLILLALATIKKGNQRLRRLTLIIIAVISVAAIARATGFVLDGKVNDWSGIGPVITDTAGDSSAGDPWEDILYGFVQRGGNRLYFRLDINSAVQQVLPEVTLSANPEAIEAGRSSTLIWNSTNSASCVIEPDVGNVDLNGSVSVSPTETTTYSITAAGPGGTATDSISVTAVDPIQLNISLPSGNDTVSGASTMVLGTVTNKRGSETGVIVNGTPAVVTGGQFAANHVPLQQGENTITVNAKDINGFIASATVSVNAVLQERYINLTADTESGTAPFETTLKVDGSFTFTNPAITYTGPGVVEFPDNQNENEYTVKITTPGIYFFTASAQDDQNKTFADTIGIQVFDKTELDALLKAKWDGVRQALSENDVDAATSYFADANKDAYQRTFTALWSKLPQISQDLADIQFIRMMNDSAEYDIRTVEDSDEYSYCLLFIRDRNGLWKIWAF